MGCQISWQQAGCQIFRQEDLPGTPSRERQLWLTRLPSLGRPSRWRAKTPV
jgi:hypothetical protein